MTGRSYLFLLVSFLSAFGDSVMLFTVPNGIGLDFSDVRPAVFMWLIPAVAMYLSSFTGKIFQARQKSERVDFGGVFLIIALIETITSIIIINSTNSLFILICSFVFVFFYAFIKEGIPKLFYDVQVYRYFCNDENYSQFVGKVFATQIIAYILSGICSFFLLKGFSWKYALMIDAITFVIYGLTIIFIGKNYKKENKTLKIDFDQKTEKEYQLKEILKKSDFFKIALAVPLIFGLNALSWNYLPIIADLYDVSTIPFSVLLLATLRIPGIVVASYHHKLSNLFNTSKMMIYAAGIFFSLNFIFHLFPSTYLLYFVFFSQSFLISFYWPTDTLIRSRLSRDELFNFNIYVLRKLSVFQFLACIYTLVAYTSNFSRELTLIAFPIFIAASYIYTNSKRTKK
jgi:hypothetical protein